MACAPQELRHVPLFALLDDDEASVLASQVEVKKFAQRQRIYKIGDPGSQAYVMMSGRVQVTTVDEDNQEVMVDEPGHGDFFGFASMLEQTPHQTSAIAAQADGGDGHADRAGPSISCFPAIGAAPR
jgi:CRP/FNR family cyclic AMP-dependent transcriptional regulator